MAHDAAATDLLALAVIGDSIAWGQGASRAADRPAARLVTALAAAGFRTEAEVHAVPGARSADLARQVDLAVRRPPDVAVVVIGANDLTHRVPAADAAALLGAAVRRLRQAGAEVVVAPAPDLSVVPHVPVTMRAGVRAASRDLRERQVRIVRELGGRVADADGETTRAFAGDAALFSADRFHPSSAGYAVIVGSLLPEVLAAARSAAEAA